MKWEYKQIQIWVMDRSGQKEFRDDYVDNLPTYSFEQALNKIGNLGWELIMCEGDYYTFKRPIRD